MYCKNCKQHYSSGEKYCVKCGLKLSNLNPEKSKKTLTRIILIILGIAATCVIIWTLWYKFYAEPKWQAKEIAYNQCTKERAIVLSQLKQAACKDLYEQSQANYSSCLKKDLLKLDMTSKQRADLERRFDICHEDATLDELFKRESAAKSYDFCVKNLCSDFLIYNEYDPNCILPLSIQNSISAQAPYCSMY